MCGWHVLMHCVSTGGCGGGRGGGCGGEEGEEGS